MSTCHVTCKIDPAKTEGLEIYAKAWIPLVERFGGTHHGYFLPREGQTIWPLRHFRSRLWPLTKRTGRKVRPILIAKQRMISPLETSASCGMIDTSCDLFCRGMH